MNTELMISIISVVAAVVAIGYSVYVRFSDRKKAEEERKAREENKGLKEILNFSNDEIVFVFAPREDAKEAVLPRISVEDFLAINNMITALLKIGRDRSYKIRDTTRLSMEEKRKNLITICCSKTNIITKEVLDETMKNSAYSDMFEFEQYSHAPDDERWRIKDNTATIESPSYDRIKDYIAEGLTIPDQMIEDRAMIAKVPNPWNDKNKVLIVAGIRGIGTWGAAECVKKNWQEIFKKKSDSDDFRKDGDFAAIIQVCYDNCDIKPTRVYSMKDFT